jgi:hypothetical protein
MLTEIKGDIWEARFYSSWRVIPTNCEVKTNGLAVMGAGVALQAVQRYSWLAASYGKQLSTYTTPQLSAIPDSRLLLFPTKYRARERSSLTLIESMSEELAKFLRGSQMTVVMPRVGAGLGGLRWSDVKSVLVAHLDVLPNPILVVTPDAR